MRSRHHVSLTSRAHGHSSNRLKKAKRQAAKEHRKAVKGGGDGREDADDGAEPAVPRGEMVGVMVFAINDSNCNDITRCSKSTSAAAAAGVAALRRLEGGAPTAAVPPFSVEDVAGPFFFIPLKPEGASDIALQAVRVRHCRLPRLFLTIKPSSPAAA